MVNKFSYGVLKTFRFSDVPNAVGHLASFEGVIFGDDGRGQHPLEVYEVGGLSRDYASGLRSERPDKVAASIALDEWLTSAGAIPWERVLIDYRGSTGLAESGREAEVWARIFYAANMPAGVRKGLRLIFEQDEQAYDDYFVGKFAAEYGGAVNVDKLAASAYGPEVLGACLGLDAYLVGQGARAGEMVLIDFYWSFDELHAAQERRAEGE